ncbi:MAG: SGNH/GDSL hydrolase family protein [Jatrophihabitans sp.]
MRITTRQTLAALCGVVALATSAAVSSPAAATTPTGGVYVAMGDSYTAGPLILPQSDLLTCVRSSANYPGLVAASLHPTAFRDVSCSSAQTKDFSAPQKGAVSGTNPPQYNALSADTTLVSVGIGGNDIGLVGLAESCINVLPAPIGKSCAAKYTAGGVDVYSQKIQAFAPTYGTVIAQIRSRAPHAKILLVGYPTAIRNGGCFPVQPVLPPDATYLQAKIDELNSVMKAQAQSNGASYVDIRTSSVGHDSCALPGIRWLEGLVPLSPAFPLHPNELEMQNTTRVVLGQLSQV